jgi:hypothetical protein
MKRTNKNTNAFIIVKKHNVLNVMEVQYVVINVKKHIAENAEEVIYVFINVKKHVVLSVVEVLPQKDASRLHF